MCGKRSNPNLNLIFDRRVCSSRKNWQSSEMGMGGVPTRPPCSLVLSGAVGEAGGSGALSDGKVGGSPCGFFWAGDPGPLWPPSSPQAVTERQNCFGDACAAPAQGAQGRAAFPGLPAPSSALPLPPFPPKSPFPQSKPVFPSQSLNQSDVSPFPQPTR